MLAAVGVSSVEDLFADIPQSARLERELDLPAGMSEMELTARLESLAGRDAGASSLVSFMGAGCYDSFVPAIVDSTISRPEFFTAYTPYQPEVSPGHAAGDLRVPELRLPPDRHGRGQRVHVRRRHGDGRGRACWPRTSPGGIASSSPAACIPNGSTRCARTPRPDCSSPSCSPWSRVGVRLDVAAPLLEDAACLVVADPNFLGTLEDLAAGRAPGARGGRALRGRDGPLAHGRPRSAGRCPAPTSWSGRASLSATRMSFGGPGFGFFAARSQYLRRMPGRIVGRTVDVEGARGFVLTMQTREQHIRREKATSNICSNHALNALAATVHLCMLGPEGLAETGRAAVAKAHYLRDALIATGRFSAPWDAPFAREFVLRFDGDVAEMQAAALDAGYLAGVALDRFPELEEILGVPLDDLVLFAVTEKRTRDGDRRVRDGGGRPMSDTHLRGVVPAGTGEPSPDACELPGAAPCGPARIRPGSSSSRAPPVSAASRCPSSTSPSPTGTPRSRAARDARRRPLPELAEVDVARHFAALASVNFGVDDGLLPAGQLHDEVQPARQRARVPASRLRRSAPVPAGVHRPGHARTDGRAPGRARRGRGPAGRRPCSPPRARTASSRAS